MTVSVSITRLNVNIAGYMNLTVTPQTKSETIDMLQEQATQSLSLVVSTGSVALARQPRSELDMLLDESGVVLDFLLDGYIWKV